MITGTSGPDRITPGGVSPGVLGGIPGDEDDAILGAADADTIDAGFGMDLIDGGPGDDALSGGPGDDVLSGGAGNDTLDGGSGGDVLLGGEGNDYYILGDLTDRFVDTSGEDTMETAADLAALPLDIEGLVVSGSGAMVHANALDNLIIGSEFTEWTLGLEGNDTINARGGSDKLHGGAGNDWLDGGTDTTGDTMWGGAGNDRFVVDSGRDMVIEVTGEGNDTVTATTSCTLPAFVEDLILAGAAPLAGFGNADANHFTGNAAANLLDGAGGDDTIKGGKGADTLLGGAGADLLNGGKGPDVFRYLAPLGTPDTIRAYNGRQDGIEVSAAAFGGDLVAGMTMAGEGRFTANATGTPDGFLAQFILNTTTGLLRWDADGVNDISAIDVAFLPGAKGLTGAEILVIA